MTIPSTIRRAGPFTGTGALVSYPFNFKVFASSDTLVAVSDTNGLETILVLDSGYSVTLSPDQDATPGGTVMYAVGGVPTALPLGYKLTITGGGLPLDQPADLPQGGNFNPVVVENALDRLEMQIQNQAVELDRTLQTAITSPVSLALPAPVAGQLLGWNATLDGLVNYAPDASSAAGLQIRLANPLSTVDGDAMVAVKRTFASAVATTLHAWHEAQVIDAVAECGMSTAASAAVNTAALNVAIATAAALGAAGARARVEIQAGNYALTAGTNFASAGVTVVGRGKVMFDYSAGAGIAFKLDAGGAAALIQRVHWENIYIKGGPAITDIFYSRGIVRSLFRNIEIKEGSGRGFALLFPVLNTYDRCVISDDTGAMTTKPAYYWWLDDDGLVGDHAQCNTFINCEASGIGAASVATGWHLQNAILNTWIGGTGESMQTGINIANDVCRMNSWIGFDIEDNYQTDVIYRGFANSFDTMFFQSTAVTHNVDVVSGTLANFDACYIREANLRPASSDTIFKGCYFDDNVALGIQNTGSFKRVGCITNTGGVGGNKTGTLRDVLGPNAAATLSGSQNNTPAQTVTLNEVTVTGRMCQQRGKIAFTAAGTAGNSIAVTIDASFPAKASAVGLPVGQFVFTQSGGTRYTGAAVLNTSTVLVFTVSSGTNNFGINPAITIANGDTLTFCVDYPLE